jgi:hypothetical protein
MGPLELWPTRKFLQALPPFPDRANQWRDLLEARGCLARERTDLPHTTLGMVQRCQSNRSMRLRQIRKAHATEPVMPDFDGVERPHNEMRAAVDPPFTAGPKENGMTANLRDDGASIQRGPLLAGARRPAAVARYSLRLETLWICRKRRVVSASFC